MFCVRAIVFFLVLCDLLQRKFSLIEKLIDRQTSFVQGSLALGICLSFLNRQH